MFNSLVQKYRRHKLIQMIEANGRSHMPYLGSCDERVVFDLIHGELKYWEPGTLTLNDAEDVQLPPINKFNRLSRKYTDSSIDNIKQIVDHLLEKKYAPQAGVKLLTLGGRDWYISPLSLMHDDHVVLTHPDRPALFVPSAIISVLPYDTISRMHPYVTPLIDLCCGVTYSDAKPVIKMVELPSTTKEAAITYKRDIPGADGIYDHVACDLIIDIAQLDNSSTPIIDVAEFCHIFSESTVSPRKYTVDVSRIKLLLGHFPQPIEVGRLKDEVGEHRVIFSSEPDSDVSFVAYKNASVLPTTYP